ncbi:hypothetical protein AAHA92_08895 [Salvia divinorum]|uniref:Uncharacterized protein n=1 Tax=Salvia divinorum TaxID=28513 RepID=A0ABD1HPP0_SALDI
MVATAACRSPSSGTAPAAFCSPSHAAAPARPATAQPRRSLRPPPSALVGEVIEWSARSPVGATAVKSVAVFGSHRGSLSLWPKVC